jgi:hypothetical protein
MYAIAEHIEYGGVHSGDASMVRARSSESGTATPPAHAGPDSCSSTESRAEYSRVRQVLPSDLLPRATKLALKAIMAAIGKALNISGP